MQKSKVALITGITGQDGTYLAERIDQSHGVNGYRKTSAAGHQQVAMQLLPKSIGSDHGRR